MFYKDGLLREYITVHSIVRDILDLFFKYFDFPLKKFDIVIGPDFETKGYYGFILMRYVSNTKYQPGLENRL